MEENSKPETQSFSAHPEVRLARIAAKQHGVVSRRQLLAIGIGDTAIGVRVARGGLHRIHTGVYAVGHPQLTQEGRWMAGVVACGQDAVLSHLDAAVLWGLRDRVGARVHVTVKWQRRIDGLVVHRTRRLDPDETTRKDGIPVTTVARTLVDLTEQLSEDRLLRAMREAEYRRLLDLTALAAAVERAHGRRRLNVLKRAIALHRPGEIVRSELEDRFLKLVRGSALPEPAMNASVRARGSRYVIDCLWADLGLVVELDGRDAHARELAFEADRRRDAALTAIGLRPLRFTWQRITYEPEGVLTDLTAAMNRSSLSWSR